MKRFYREVSVAAAPDGWQVMLDSRPVHTAGGKPQVVPSRALAEALAEEWAGQSEEIEASAFVLRDFADFAIDHVLGGRERTIADLLAYAETDTLCYQAAPDEPLFQRQTEIWEPLLQALETRLAIRFERVSGVVAREQPAATLASLRGELENADPFVLAALATLASLAASLTVALAATADDADGEALWYAASLEEEWQADLWGRESEAEERRALRKGAFLAAMRFARLAQAG